MPQTIHANIRILELYIYISSSSCNESTEFPNSLSLTHFTHPLSLYLSRHPSLLFIAPDWSSRCVRILMSVSFYWSAITRASSLLHHKCPACLVRSNLMVWDGSHVAVNWLFCDVLLPGFVHFSLGILVLLLFSCSFFLMRLVSVYVVHPYHSIYSAAAWKKSDFISSARFDFHMIDSLSIVIYAFTKHMLISISVDVILLPSYLICSTKS